MIVAAQVMVIRGHQGQTSVLLLNHFLMGMEESRWQVPSDWSILCAYIFVFATINNHRCNLLPNLSVYTNKGTTT